ncbi:MAG: 1-deoxy-D-xylulose-5-phosphate synthase [Firmicutes bacterium]|nr:1-deoxy-D-xylulose-5-phosphate synthase [Bacillota bacterium]
MYIEKTDSPEKLKKLEIKKLDILAKEIRSFLIESVSKTGGHLASNLGVVDLTIALHYVFSPPKDKIIWDVGHQCYTHKILTGRKSGFDTLRQFEGMSGFPCPDESESDVFASGHSSASIAAALGLAKARDLSGENYNVVSVIGDGAMTGGLAFEALNNIGNNKTKLTIVLNDNQMSISPNVGGLNSYLNRLRIADGYMDAKVNIKKGLDNIPIVGRPIKSVLEHTKEGIKHTLIPVNIFEAYGLKYVGPVDGHDIKKMVAIFNKVKNMKEPVLVHVLTRKGKGYVPAEDQPNKYHGVSAFDAGKGIVAKEGRKKTYSEVFGEKLVSLAEKNKKICALTAAMASGTGLEDFSKKFPERFIDVGIAEEFAVTYAAGLAKGGYIPFFAVYSTFLQRAYDQILHDVCLQKLHVIFAVDRAGIVGSDGITHQGIYDISFLTSIPNLTVMAPKNKAEFEAMMDFAVEAKGPVAIRYPRGEAQSFLSANTQPLKKGKSECIYRGEKIALLSLGSVMGEVLKVYTLLIGKGYSPTVINARFASPIDSELIKELTQNHSHIFTVEDNIVTAGFGEKVAAQLCELGYKGVFKAFAFPKKYVEHGTRKQLFEKYGLNGESIFADILKTLGES